MASLWLIYIPSMFSLDRNTSRKLVLCIARACTHREWVFFIYFYTSSPPPCAYAWFLTRLLLHKNAIQWISFHWMVWFGSQSVSSPCPWEACSVLLPAVYLWAGLSPAFLIIHETSKGRKRSQHHAGSLSQPMQRVKNIQFSLRLWNENRWGGIGRKSISDTRGFTASCGIVSCFVWIYYFALKNKWGLLMIGCPYNLLCLISEPPIMNLFSLTWCCSPFKITHQITQPITRRARILQSPASNSNIVPKLHSH